MCKLILEFFGCITPAVPVLEMEINFEIIQQEAALLKYHKSPNLLVNYSFNNIHAPLNNIVNVFEIYQRDSDITNFN
jgi:hypothetical protein